MPRSSTLLLVAALLPAALSAQWRISLLGSSASTSAHASIDDASERIDVAPDRPNTIALGVSREMGVWRLGIAVHRTRSDLVLRGPETAIVTRGDLAAWGAGLEAGRRLLGGVGRPMLHAMLGVAHERWTFPVTGGDPRTLTTAHGALEASVPFSPRWSGLVRGEAALGGSLFDAEELPSGYGVRAGRQWGIGLGLGWRP